ncbi:50S ribosomal protein L16 [Candidatus Woesearchaeota archaeon CG_4_10_14_0_8_um_filter_47_5]|nr:MAG: 50S ribosomal protein L16 [Candidatus Woesearchaeota archaeon CG_4_10_14_0_8_um_filter_47_5]
MARLRKFCSYRRLERPYTRISKYRKKSYIKINPNCKIVKFDMGEASKKFPFSLALVSKTDLQIRHEALESARKTSNRILEKVLGKTGYFMRVRVYPYHILRENPLASGAGADRMSTGMAKAFGKPIGIAAQVKKGQPVFSIDVEKKNLTTARLALKRASYKLPNSYAIEVVQSPEKQKNN